MDEPALAERIGALIDGLGRVAGPVKRALRAVPRHEFVPAVALIPGDGGGLRAIDRAADSAGWWEAVYSDTPIVTQLDDGALSIADVVGPDGVVRLPSGADYTSSASAPSTVAALLGWLAPDPGHRIMEIGTGTGWTAALLAHLVGDGDLVTSIEVDLAVAEQAAKNLAVAGFGPRLVIGDGAVGTVADGPYDRVHVTCGVRAVPYTWVAQTRPGGTIVLPYCPGFGADHALRLIVAPGGVAHGTYPGFASYMMMRSQRPADGVLSYTRDHQAATTAVDPRTIAYAPAGADLAIHALTGLRSQGLRRPDFYRLWVYDADGSDAAAVTWRPGRREFEVRGYGRRPVWDEVVDAYFRWVAWGQPGRARFGMTVTPDGQKVWLDGADRIIG
ncbi:protein-L-isoaspartate(D-aspartate) O-methyltransferase [Streptosporangium sp. NPDC006007]|uniref:protein-L-isoaspartate(D-aspartate) O-methyltransferase n=1 Tax=Streptosporangium sp. NPDC006007 TaxID=3154575 RepID=UPI0033B194D1